MMFQVSSHNFVADKMGKCILNSNYVEHFSRRKRHLAWLNKVDEVWFLSIYLSVFPTLTFIY